MAFVNTVVFASFAVFASVRLAMGYSSCGCSGSLELPAWVFVLIDVAIVILSTSSTRRRSQIANGLHLLTQSWKSCPSANRGRFVALLLFAFFIAILQLPFAAPLKALALGEPPLKAIVEFDKDLVFRQESSGTVRIRNRSSLPTKIIGMEASCSCFELDQDPKSATIPANEEVAFRFVVKPNRTGPLHQRGVLFLDHPKMFRLNFDFVGFVKGVEK